MEMMTVAQLKEKHRRERIIKEREIRRKKTAILQEIKMLLTGIVIVFVSWLMCCMLFVI